MTRFLVMAICVATGIGAGGIAGFAWGLATSPMGPEGYEDAAAKLLLGAGAGALVGVGLGTVFT